MLIIDDDKEVIEVASLVLVDLFDHIDGTNTVEEAQQAITDNTYSLIFLDIRLANRNGAEVIKFLDSSLDNLNKAVPFIIFSGIITPQFIERYEKRFAGILMKPFNHAELRKITEEVLKGKKNDLEEQISEESLLEEVPNLICQLPFPIVQLEQKVTKILDQVRKSPKLKQLFKQMKIDRNADNYISTHIGILINISTAICIQMEWSTDKTLEKFVYASYLHDMALAERPDLARINSFEALESLKATLSPVDYKLVLEHPNIAANTIEDMSEIPADVAAMIRQHHELPKGDGYPSKCSHQKIAPLTVVFIVAQDLAEYIIANPVWKIEDYVAKSKVKFQGSHFTKIFRSLSEIK